MILDSEVTSYQRAGVQVVRVKILAYLGQLKPGEFVSAKKLVSDLDLRFTTAKNTLTMLEERGLVEKVISNNKAVVALFRLDAAAHTIKKNSEGVTVRVPYIPPQWEDAYGRHPYAP